MRREMCFLAFLLVSIVATTTNAVLVESRPSKSDYEPLQIDVSPLDRDSMRLLSELNAAPDVSAAISFIERTVSVRRGQDAAAELVHRHYIESCASGTPIDHHLVELAVNRSATVQQSARLLLLLQVDHERCAKDELLMASAKPCYAYMLRPSVALMTLCDNFDGRWDGFTNIYDLVRHELLHALGYGMYAPSESQLSVRAPPSRGVQWNLAKGRSERFMAHYMDFSARAAYYARIHLGCKDLHGVEAEDEYRTHLSEYVFGDELMTPLVSNEPNRFTEISALILEDTYLGDQPWYRVDRRQIEPETQAYWYGRRWGCTFAESSCYDFARERALSHHSSFPFCSVASYVSPNTTESVCVSNGTDFVQIPYQCQAYADVLEEVDDETSSSSGPGSRRLKPSPLSVQFDNIVESVQQFEKDHPKERNLAPPEVRYAVLYGSSASLRFCPFAQLIVEGDTSLPWMKNGVFTDCAAIPEN